MSFKLLEEFENHKISEKGKKKLNILFEHCNTLLGGVGIDVHLENEDYIFAFRSALNTYRSRSTASVKESFGVLRTKETQNEYTLSKEVDVVQRISRTRGAFGGFGVAGNFESFGAATINQLLRGSGGAAGTMSLLTYEVLMQYQETLSRIFAREVNFTYEQETQKLLLHYIPKVPEVLLLEVSVLKNIDELLDNYKTYNWLQKYTLAVSKTILGEKYSLFSAVAGPSGGTFMKGDSLKDAGITEMEVLEQDILDFVDGGEPVLPTRG